MNREALESLDKETLIRLVQAQTISALPRQIEFLTARVSELEAKLGLPPKTPDNSSPPPSQGRKPSDEAASKPTLRQAQGHAARRRAASVAPEPGASTRYDGGGLPALRRRRFRRGADRVRSLRPCRNPRHQNRCHAGDAARRRAARRGSRRRPRREWRPVRLLSASKGGPTLRALVIYLRFTQGIAFARLARLLSGRRGLDISKGALVNMRDAAKDVFAKASGAIPARLLCGIILARQTIFLTSLRAKNRLKVSARLQSGETGLRAGEEKLVVVGLPS
jgi:transposase